jgi:succinate dehydrogenase flavin-adding protein (antitoxin of CptAB toxin-antitoxin module)
MKELDILLQRFVDHQQDVLAGGAWPEFEALLQTEDDVLWDWFQDPALPGAQPYHALIKQIRCAPR